MAARVDLGSGGERRGRARGAGRAAPPAGGAVGLADHGAVPRRPAGGCAGGVHPRARAPGRRARHRTRRRDCGRSSSRCCSRARRWNRRRRPRRSTVPGNLPAVAAPFVGREAETADAGVAGQGAPAGDGRRARRRRQDASRDRGRPRPGRARRGLAGPAGRRRPAPPTCPRSSRRPCTSPGASGRCSSAWPAPRPCCCSTTVSTWSRAWVRLPASLLDAVPRLRLVATSQVPLGIEAERVYVLEPLSSEHSVALFVTRARAMRRQFVLDADTAALVGGGVPVPRRTAPGHRAGRRARAVALGARHRQAARRPVRVARGPHQHPPPAQPRPRQRDRAGATTCCSPTTSAGCGRSPALPGVPRWTRPSTCWWRSAYRPPRCSTRSAGSSPGRMVSVGRRRRRCGALPAARQHPGVRRRPAPRGRPVRGGAGRPRRLVRHDRGLVRRARARRPAARMPGDRACGAREHRRRAAVVRRARSRSSACGSPTDSAGPGWSSVTGPAGAGRVRRALSRSTPDRDRAIGAAPRRVARGVRRGPRPRGGGPRRPPARSPTTLDDEVLRADTQRHRAFLRIQQGRPQDVLACAADQPGDVPIACHCRGRPPASLVLAAYGSLMLGDTDAARPGTPPRPCSS